MISKSTKMRMTQTLAVCLSSLLYFAIFFSVDEFLFGFFPSYETFHYFRKEEKKHSSNFVHIRFFFEPNINMSLTIHSKPDLFITVWEKWLKRESLSVVVAAFHCDKLKTCGKIMEIIWLSRINIAIMERCNKIRSILFREELHE